MWRVLKGIYNKVESTVLLGDYRTDFFDIVLGLRQGCILSPLLFNLFVNDLKDILDKLNKGIKLGNMNVSMLSFADDIVVMAESKKDLELALQSIYQYSLKWRINFNYDKCKVVVFDNIDRRINCCSLTNNACSCSHHFRFGTNFITEVLIYKYLGVKLDNRLSYKLFHNRILTKARSIW